MKEVSKFLKIFKPKEIIETILTMIIMYLLIDMFNIPTVLEKYGIYSMAIFIVGIIFLVINKGFLNLFKANIYNYLDYYL